MADYAFLDGPLAGMTLVDDDHGEGEVITVEVTDVGTGSSELAFTYRVERTASDQPGHLRFVAEQLVGPGAA